MLNPCKACGSSLISEYQSDGWWVVRCADCGARGPGTEFESFDWWNKANPVVAASPLRLDPCVSCFSFPSWDQSGSVSCRVICHRAAPSGEEWNKMNPLPEMNKCSDCGAAPYMRGAGVLYAVAECVCGKSVQAATVARAVEKWNEENPALPAAAPCLSCAWPTPALLESGGRYRLYCDNCGGVSEYRDTKEGAVESWNAAPVATLPDPCQPECKETPGVPSAPPTCPLCQSQEVEIEWMNNLCYAVCDKCGYKGGSAGMSADAHEEFRKKPELKPCPLCQAEGETLGVSAKGDVFCAYCLVAAPHENWQGFKRPEPKPPFVSSCRSCAGDASIGLSPDGLYYFTCDSCFMRGPNMKSEDLAREKWNELSDCSCEEEPF